MASTASSKAHPYMRAVLLFPWLRSLRKQKHPVEEELRKFGLREDIENFCTQKAPRVALCS